jgi:hypothetical protein
MLRTTVTLFLVLASTACGRSTTTPEEIIHGSGSSDGGAQPTRTVWGTPADPGPPFYARIDPAPPHIFDDATWAAVVFYRPSTCVPADFNLLDFFHPPAMFACDLLVSGASHWHGAPGVGSPRVTTASGSPEVWIFPASAVPGLLADAVLTIGELAAVPGLLTGTASQFHETLQPHPLPPEFGGGGHPNPSITLVARGELDDGRGFQFQLTHDDGGTRSVRIMLR